ncbi:alcohol dehydrogenase [Microbacterium faecale]|uniref:Alcohol dehydrogenase n=1 Tax=Microbacterium faecale TaxID=1804630 RepID=A0A916Y344_9MICO|nr:iron-containing alcohol dehydrogenase [Microbacterium faecale]GGD27433.1 alcohol dehydrogenase [Microbacterium faecale]
MSGILRLPARVHFGYGARAQIPALLSAHGTRVFALVDPFLIGTELLDEVLTAAQSADLTVEVCADVQPELPVASLDEVAARARAFAPDAILAIGGGSALDAAKLVALLLAHGGPLSRFYGENAVPGAITPVVAAPTTAGTGSEVTPIAVVTDPDRALKVGVSSPHLVPVAAVVDPTFTLDAPANVTAFSGIDALVHAVESYTAAAREANWTDTLPVFIGRNVLTDPLSLAAIEKLGTWLPTAVADPSDRRAREEVALGSLLAGIAFGSTGTHLSHALQYPIGAETGTPHGLGTGLMLPYVLDAVRADPAVTERLAVVGSALGSPADDIASRANDAIAAVARINRQIGVPTSLADIGITRDQLPRIAELALASERLVTISPAPVTMAMLGELLERAWAGDLRT